MAEILNQEWKVSGPNFFASQHEQTFLEETQTSLKRSPLRLSTFKQFENQICDIVFKILNTFRCPLFFLTWGRIVLAELFVEQEHISHHRLYDITVIVRNWHFYYAAHEFKHFYSTFIFLQWQNCLG